MSGQGPERRHRKPEEPVRGPSDETSFAPDVVGPSLLQRAAAEALGTGVLLLAIVGASVAATSAIEPGVQTIINALTAALALGLMVHLVAPVSGGHLNPAVSLGAWLLGRRGEVGLDNKELGVYVGSQVVGAILGVLLANALWDLSVFTTSTIDRDTAEIIVSEFVATAGLVFVVFALTRTGRAAAVGIGLFAWLLAAGAFSPSGAFANPAVSVGRWFTDAPSGIAGSSIPAFVIAQLLGAVLAVILAVTIFGTLRRR